MTASTRLSKLNAHLTLPQDRRFQFSRLLRFESAGLIYFADLGAEELALPAKGSVLKGYSSLEDINKDGKAHDVCFEKLLAPVPRTDLPIYCAGLNYRSHALEASLEIPSTPPLWLKGPATLANPFETIYLNGFCQESYPDYEGEIVFVTSKDALDVSPDAADSYILGYTIGNDLSCRKYQIPAHGGGQYTFAKGFDKFAPIGPVLLSPELFHSGDSAILTTKVNDQQMQHADFYTDSIWKPNHILSHMSQGTTIPKGTIVMTGTPAGVGIFQDPARMLQDGDVIEIEVSNIGILKNTISFK